MTYFELETASFVEKVISLQVCEPAWTSVSFGNIPESPPSREYPHGPPQPGAAACRTHGHPTSKCCHVTTYTLYRCEIERRHWKFNVFYHMVMVMVVMVRLRVVRVRIVMVRDSG